MKISLPYGDESVSVEVPDRNLAGIIEPQELPAVDDEESAIVDALTHPVGRHLSDIIHGGDRIAIIANDITRITPTKKLLPPLISHLNYMGIPDSDIEIVFATGSHRKHTEAEQRVIVGDEIYSRISCIDHDPDNCRRVRVTSRGTPVEIFAPVLDAS